MTEIGVEQKPPMAGPTKPRPGGGSGKCLVGNVKNMLPTSQGVFARTVVTPEGVPLPARAHGVLIVLSLILPTELMWSYLETSMVRRSQRLRTR